MSVLYIVLPLALLVAAVAGAFPSRMIRRSLSERT